MISLFRALALLLIAFAGPAAADPGDVDAAARGVVRVVVIGEDGGEPAPVSHGSGFAVSATQIVTNAHVVREALLDDTLRIGIVPSEGAGGAFARVVAVSPRNDLALLEIASSGLKLPPLALAGGVSGNLGEVSAVGYPMNVDLAQGLNMGDIFRAQPPVKSRGFVSGERPSRQFDTILHTAPIARGNSGGPLLDPCGRVIGVNSFSADSMSGDAEFYFAVSLRELLPFLRDNGVQSAALNAVLQMDADRAVPLLKRVLERQDPESACLRRRAVFMLSQHETAETSGLLVQLAKTDPDPEVRHQAVFWLSQVTGPEAVSALRDILATSTDRELQEKAIFALSQHEGPTASQALRTYAGRTDVPDELRSNAVFWLGQQGSAENAAFLRELFGRATDRELKNRILFSVSQMESAESGRWLVEVAKDTRQPTEIRKQALFWAGQSDALTTADLKGLYSSMPDRELKEHLIFVLSQQDGPAAVDELIAIVRTEPDAELKKKAIFWLAQSDDPRVAEVLANLLAAPTRRP